MRFGAVGNIGRPLSNAKENNPSIAQFERGQEEPRESVTVNPSKPPPPPARCATRAPSTAPASLDEDMSDEQTPNAARERATASGVHRSATSIGSRGKTRASPVVRLNGSGLHGILAMNADLSLDEVEFRLKSLRLVYQQEKKKVMATEARKQALVEKYKRLGEKKREIIQSVLRDRG